MQKKCQDQKSHVDRGLRVKEAAAMLGISVSTLWRLTRQGRIQNRRLSDRCTVWLESEILNFLQG
ncbi:MAG: helix-turn-helix domain-containing protein [Desulfovibrionaceae bacterium]|nr:helix-turn-helix domain-containing protein [Desulfovibrionaceae bacterium]